jgi:APA family basic amino acid/polyamine antiporter
MTDDRAPARTLGPLGVGSIVFGAIVGVGIFFLPATVAAAAPSGPAVLGLWVGGGLLSALGALVLGELGARLPREGGPYAFLREGLGPRVGPPLAFLYGWTNLLVVQPGAMGVIALVLGANVGRLVGGLPPAGEVGVALAAVAGLAALAAAGLRVGQGVQVALTAAKLLAIALLVGLGAVAGDPARLLDGATPPPAAWPGVLAAGGVPVLFAYAGWQHGAFVAGLARDPRRSLPLGIGGGLAAVIVAYVAVNAAYLALLGPGGMAASRTLAADAAAVALGDAAGDALAAGIVVSAAGVLATQLFGFPWVLHAMARDGLFPAAAGALHPRAGTPVASIGALAACAAVAVVVGQRRLDQLVAGLGFAEWALLALTGVALLRLRPHTEGPRLLPTAGVVAFVALAAGVAAGAVVVAPWASAWGFVATGVGLAGWAARRRRPAP